MADEPKQLFLEGFTKGQKYPGVPRKVTEADVLAADPVHPTLGQDSARRARLRLARAGKRKEMVNAVRFAVGFMIASNVYTTLGYLFDERIWARIRWEIDNA